jgi:hypothetical protein
MWRQLSGFDKFRFVCGVFVLPITVVATILFVMAGQWGQAAVQAFLAFSFAYSMHRIVTRDRGRAKP